MGVPDDFDISCINASGMTHLITVVRPRAWENDINSKIFIFPNREFNNKDSDNDRIISIGIIPKQNVLRILTAEYLITISEDMISIESVRPHPDEYEQLQSSVEAHYDNEGELLVARSLPEYPPKDKTETVQDEESEHADGELRYEIVSGCRSLNIPVTLPQEVVNFARNNFSEMPLEKFLNECKNLVGLLRIKVKFTLPDVNEVEIETEGN